MLEYQPFIPQNPDIRLVHTPPNPPYRQWTDKAAQLINSGVGTWRVSGVAGSGVSSLLIDTVIERIRAGWDPASILVITSSKEAAAKLRREISELVVDVDYVSAGSLVRSVHSLAFALIREVSDIRLITGAEQDAVIREILRGHAADSRGSWTAELREGLTMLGFARQLRDFLLRVIERGVGPDELVELGRNHNRPNWSAAGEFLTEYQQIMRLSGSQNLSAAELIVTALAIPEFGSSFRGVFVDDAQHLDPQSAELVSRFFPDAELAVVAGDPEQSVFHFRGANSHFLKKLVVDEEVVLDVSRRDPHVRIAIAETESVHQDLIADTIRRAHLIDGIPWSDSAVIVRSAGMIAPVRRVLLAAGIPVHISPTDVVLSQERSVAAIILGLRALTEPLNPAQLEDLLLGPIGGADPVTLRRLLRGLRQAEMKTGGNRRAINVLQTLLEANTSDKDIALREFLTERELELLARVRAVLIAGRTALGGSVEEVLWAVWSATGLSEHLLATSLRGGAAGSQADRDLDAIMALFDAAGDYVERRPSASIGSFIRHIVEQELPTGMRERRGVNPAAVTVLTAHAAAGNQWRHVVIAGVQENSWPSLGETGTLFGQEEFIDLVDEGIDPDIYISRSLERLAEERRLFHLATSRAQEKLLITAINAGEAEDQSEPSRFLNELKKNIEHIEGYTGTKIVEPELRNHRLLSVPALVAELRRAVSSADEPESRRRQAARQLARLAAAQVPGADPAQWASLTQPSTTAELLKPGQVTLSPSRIESVLNCPLRAVLDRLTDQEETPLAMLKGTLIHAFAEAVARGADVDTSTQLVTDAFLALAQVPSWAEEKTKNAFRRTLERTHTWLLTSRATFSELGVETKVTVSIDEEVRISGRIDRLERNENGDLVVVDLKTGTSIYPQKDMGEHPQLFAYQLALSRGVQHGSIIEDPLPGETPEPIGGGVLVYPAAMSTAITTREQAPKTEEELDEFAAVLPELARILRGPQLRARINSTCANCPVKGICPVQPEGAAICG